MNEERIELMNRGRVKTRSRDNDTDINGRTFVERKIKPGDTLNKIALQYQVQVSDSWVVHLTLERNYF